MNVFVVVGSTGEYSDRSEWFVAAYADQAMAEQHATLAAASARESYASAELAEFPYEVRDAATNPYDTSMQMDYTGAHYYVRPVPLLDAIPNAAGGAA